MNYKHLCSSGSVFVLLRVTFSAPQQKFIQNRVNCKEHSEHLSDLVYALRMNPNSYNNGEEGVEEEAEEFSEEEEEEQDPNLGQDPNDQSDEGSSKMTASEDEAPWISWFINIRGNDFFCEVEESFIQDDFNLTGLSSQVPFYDYALDMILDIDIPMGTSYSFWF